MIYTLYIFSARGQCLFYTEWYRPHSMLKDLPDEDRKLMFGLLFSLKQLMNKANPLPCVARGLRGVIARATPACSPPPSAQGAAAAAAVVRPRERLFFLHDGLVRAAPPRDAHGVQVRALL